MRTVGPARGAVLAGLISGPVLLTALPASAHQGGDPSTGHVLIDLIIWAGGAAAVLGGMLVLFRGLRAVGQRLQRR